MRGRMSARISALFMAVGVLLCAAGPWADAADTEDEEAARETRRHANAHSRYSGTGGRFMERLTIKSQV